MGNRKTTNKSKITNNNSNENEIEKSPESSITPRSPSMEHKQTDDQSSDSIITTININLSDDIDTFIASSNKKQEKIQELQSNINQNIAMLNQVKNMCNEWRL